MRNAAVRRRGQIVIPGSPPGHPRSVVPSSACRIAPRPSADPKIKVQRLMNSYESTERTRTLSAHGTRRTHENDKRDQGFARCVDLPMPFQFRSLRVLEGIIWRLE